jgi:hypothetical protein
MAIQGYSALPDVDRARYDTYVRIKAAQRVLHAQFFDAKDIIEQTHQAVFTTWNKLTATPAATLLTGTYDITNPTPAAFTEAQVTITAYERGNIIATSTAIDYTSIISLVEVKKQLIAINAAEGLDNAAASNIYSAMAATAVPVGGTLVAQHLFQTARDFADGSVPTREDGLYACIMSPFTQYDILGDESKVRGYIPVSKYTNPSAAYRFEIGAYAGHRIVMGAAAYHATVDGVRHDYPLCFGANAFGMASGYPLQIVTVINDDMARFVKVSWKRQVGYGVVEIGYVRMYDVQPSE